MRIISRIVTSLLAVLLAACASSPLGRSQLQLVPEDQLEQMGEQAFTKLRRDGTEVRDPRTLAYVRCVVRQLTAGLDNDQRWQVAVFEDDEANAFALPGGRIGVNTGMLRVAENQDQLAAVIGHEIAHVVADHHNARLSATYAAEAASSLVAAVATDGGASPQLMSLLGLGVQYGVINPYTRSQESESDLLGLNYMARAGFDPRASVDLWRAMAAEGGSGPAFLSTHPSHGQRIETLQEAMPDVLALYRAAVRGEGRPNCR